MMPLASEQTKAFLRMDMLSMVMLTLIVFVSAVIFQYSQRYLSAEPGKTRFTLWFCCTVTAVSLLVTANHLWLLLLMWVATSLSLHQLLTFYPHRPQALIAAHKKFLVSRLADVCLLSAFVLISTRLSTSHIDVIFDRLAQFDTLPTELEWAAVLLAMGAALKCAQLPFHGWLIQVMEAPTPVSALLHAGVVNIGGFLMIRLHPLMSRAMAAQTLLVVIGCTTCVLSALIMTTRISIKVKLAWSTSAQMGFMLMQCGLGAYALALLHLVAHSFYKAYAFLNAGDVVRAHRVNSLGPKTATPSMVRTSLALAVSVAVVALVAWCMRVDFEQEPALWAFVSILGIALTSPIAAAFSRDFRKSLTLFAASITVATLYFSLHTLFSSMLGIETLPASPIWPRIAYVLGCFGAFFMLHTWLTTYPMGRLARRLYPHLYAGLYLDELFTRLTFRLWPARLPPIAKSGPMRTTLSPRKVIMS